MKCKACGGTGALEEPQALAKRLRRLREASGISQREAARKMEISAQFLCDLEAGKRRWTPGRQKEMEKICGALAC